MKSSAYNRREFLGRAVVAGAGAAVGLASVSLAAEGVGKKKTMLSTPAAERCRLYLIMS